MKNAARNRMIYTGSGRIILPFKSGNLSNLGGARITETPLFNEENHLLLTTYMLTASSKLGDAHRYSLDNLTKLYLRDRFSELLGEKISAAKRGENNLAVYMIDADHFKGINDQYGHQGGDQVLVEISSEIKRTLGKEDIVGRYGGEEIIVAASIPYTDRSGDHTDTEKVAGDIAERIRANIANLSVKYLKANFKSTNINPTVSVGYKTTDSIENLHRYDLQKIAKILTQNADEGVYLAKSRGRNRVGRRDSQAR